MDDDCNLSVYIIHTIKFPMQSYGGSNLTGQSDAIRVPRSADEGRTRAVESGVADLVGAPCVFVLAGVSESDMDLRYISASVHASLGS